jgi:predicted metalloendopeptidase
MHEKRGLIHFVFFIQGRQFDKNGNLVDWWVESQTKERYLEKAKCIIDQYGNYTATEVGLKVSN